MSQNVIPQTVIANQGDTLDLICWRYYRTTAAVTEQVLAANPQLDVACPIIPLGTPITLPDLKPVQHTSLNLWD